MLFVSRHTNTPQDNVRKKHKDEEEWREKNNSRLHNKINGQLVAFILLKYQFIEKYTLYIKILIE